MATTFAQDFQKLMDAYTELRKQWIQQTGSDEGFDQWFSLKLGIKK